MAPRAKPYRFSELERWTRYQLLVLKTFMGYLPGTGLGAEFKQSLRESISKLTGSEVDLWLDSVTTASAKDVLKKLPDPACLAVIGLPPSDHQLLLDIDIKLAGMAVDKMLGGSGEDVDPSRPLSSIESGLVSFVLLKIMHAAQQILQEEQQVGLRLKKLYAHPADVADIVGDGEQVVLGFKIFLDMQVGYARLVVPSSMVKSQLIAPVDPSGPMFARRVEGLRRRMQMVRSMRTTMVVEAGRSELQQEDLDGVDVGDILVVEKTAVRKEGEALSGEVEIRVGTGTHGVVRGNLVELEGGGLGVEVTTVECFPEPDPAGENVESAEEASPSDAVEGGGEDGEQAEEAMQTPLRPRAALKPWKTEGATRTAFAGRAVGVGGDAARGAELRDGEDQQDEEEQPEEEGGTEEQGEEAAAEDAGPEDNLAETEGLLKDIPLPVVVELGRIKSTAGDIVKLRAGQILELRRAPNDPVDITVNGKLVAKGELVEVEGELGVRLLSLTR